ncbi:MAG: hypothetical protein LAT55_08850 [Opitutales bacterium]|nr:hypothetical protein [Opitutales bacterium]
MKKKTSHFSCPYANRGSILLGVLIFAVIFAIVIVSLIRFSNSSARLNHIDHLSNEARLGAQSLLNHGMAQIHNSLSTNPYPPADAFQPGGTREVTIRQSLIDFYADNEDSRLLGLDVFSPEDFFQDPESHKSGLVAVLRDQEGRMSEVSPDALLPDGATQTTADVREVLVYAKATTNSPSVGERTSYVRQTFQMLDRSLYRYAVFYDGDLELWPGPDMSFSGGPIHSNSNIFLGANGNLRIHNQVTTAGNFFLGRHPERSSQSVGGNIFLRDFSIDADSSLAMNDQPYLRDLTNDPAWSGLLDSNNDDFRSLASQNFHGGLLSQEHGVTSVMPAGFDGLQNLFGIEEGNWNHHLIRPISQNQNFDDGFLNNEQREILQETEREKWAYQSDLIVRLVPGPTPDMDNVEIVRPRRDSEGRVMVDPVTGAPQYHDPIEVDDASRFYSVERYAPEMQPVLDSEGNPTFDSEGEPILERIPETTASGLFDYRQAEGSESNAAGEINLLRFDMGAFRDFTNDLLTSHAPAEIPHLEGIFFEMPEVVPSTPRDDLVVGADPSWAVQIHNAEVLPTGRRTNAAGRVEGGESAGLPFATNSAMYVEGHFNSPNQGGSSTDPENPDRFGQWDGEEMPVALVADSITLLSSAWQNQNSRRSNLAQRSAQNTVVSAALVAGNVPTEGGTYSGGVENYPRFLERWSGTTLTYRGSIIGLYASESHLGGWSFGAPIYTAPNRDWGYNSGYIDRPPRPFRGLTVYRRVYFQELPGPEFYRQIERLRNGELNL